MVKVLILSLFLIANAFSSAVTGARGDELPLAENCNPSVCKPPSCRCSGTILDDKIPVEQIPQLVMLTFDDAVTAYNYELISAALEGRVNPDSCPIAATFFVSHEYTDYSKVHNLWSSGHEIALHSISHNPSIQYWRNASIDLLIDEFGGQREMMAHFANIDYNDLIGMRVPLFEISGNKSYEMMSKAGIVWDSSWPTKNNAPGFWPYSLDYMSTQDCMMGHCPTAAIPGTWVNPILAWVDMQGYICAMVDGCGYAPNDEIDEIFEWMKQNFEHSYNTNRAPFGVYMHAAWFFKAEHNYAAYIKFLDYLGTLKDVYIVSESRMLQYSRNPRPGQPFDKCQTIHEKNCTPNLCLLKKPENGEERWMTSCASKCPAVYPWISNPLGESINIHE